MKSDDNDLREGLKWYKAIDVVTSIVYSDGVEKLKEDFLNLDDQEKQSFLEALDEDSVMFNVGLTAINELRKG